MDILELEKFLKQITREAGALGKKYFDQGISNYTTKLDPDDILTEADVAVSNFLVEKIHAAYPDHYIYSEEAEEVINPNGEYQWIIDPIDGTRNFAAGIPMWCVLIAVRKNNETILGTIYNPISDQLFFGKKGGGSFLNGRPIMTNQTSEIDYAFGHFSRSTRRPFSKEYAQALAWFNINTKVRAGNYSSELFVGHLAAGLVDFQINNGGVDHDYFAPFLIAEEAGIVVTDSEGNPWQPGRSDVILANPILHPKLLAAFKKANEV